MDWIKYRLIYFAFSGLLLGIGIFSLIAWKMNFSIDFTGGTVIEYQKKSDGSHFTEKISSTITQEQAQREDAVITRFESVGPTFSKEIFMKTLTALIIVELGILLWIGWQFKSFQFGISAILATLHDTFILIGAFSLMGHFSNAPTDTLFVTALLTTRAFSVYDTIVVFDRIRELKRKVGGNIYDLANLAVSQTMVRSLNNSLTIIFVLVALVLLGGKTIFWFNIALLIGTITGTYSSPFIAVPLLVTWEDIKLLIKRR
ncbi:protein translocase subunit SecF [Candidatus Microgenomates bacterium]|nr:protein translocase subunit SecF [Candidatus Microgenomates bacterium]